MAKVEYNAVGRRKKAVARVRLVAGDGKITINKRDIDAYFGLETLKKEDKQVTELVSDNASHEAKGEPSKKGGDFNTAARNAASSNRSKAESNKKFSEESKRQRKIDMFKDFVKSLGVDAESTANAEKILKKFDEISKFVGKSDK